MVPKASNAAEHTEQIVPESPQTLQTANSWAGVFQALMPIFIVVEPSNYSVTSCTEAQNDFFPSAYVVKEVTVKIMNDFLS